MKLLIAADFVPNDRVATQIKAGDFSCINEIKSLLQSVDYSIVNLESPVVSGDARPIVKTGPNLCCTEQAMNCLSSIGFNCVTLANNHFRDYGQIGVEDTITICQKYGMDYVGGGENLNKAEQVLYKYIGGKRLAIINVCENEWSIAGGEYGGSAPLNPVRNFNTIQEARQKADYVLVIVHGGIEYYPYPTPRMVDLYRFFVKAGADAVINHHQHCFSGYEKYLGKPIFYGLGNFCFDRKGQRGSIWNEGYVVKLQFGTDKDNYEIIPYTQCDERPAVILMDSKQKVVFNDRINKINDFIRNPELLNREFLKLVDLKTKVQLQALEPISSVAITHLQARHLFPFLFREKQRKAFFIRMRCESHRELLIEILKNSFNL